MIDSLPEQIKDIFEDYRKFVNENNNDIYEKEWNIQGWVRDFRSQSEFAFISIYDGSISQTLQILCEKNKLDNFESLDNLRGATVKVNGIVKKSPAKGQEIELVCNKIEPLGLVNDKTNIILAKTVNLETLRNHQYLRSRFKSFSYIYKIRSTLLKNIHKFFNEKNFYNLDPNIITTSDCEGAGEVFTITNIDSNELINKVKTNEKLPDNIYSQDFFQKQAFLTVSSQLQLEAFTAGLSRVYTLNPSFRAEKSKTKRHLACFTHLEWEISFIDLNQLMDFSELLIKNVIRNTLEDCSFEYNELNKFLSKGIIEKLNNIVNNNFERITYDQALIIIEENKKNIIKMFSKEMTINDIPKWGDDLGSFCERYICEVIYKKPVFVYNYPKDLKSFYMKLNDDNNTVQACDLLVNGIGEMIGSSMREDNYDLLVKRMDEKNMDKSKLQWYIDLRKNSTFQHGGAGLGFDRLVNLCSLIDGNIRDVVPFPVAYQECDY